MVWRERQAALIQGYVTTDMSNKAKARLRDRASVFAAGHGGDFSQPS